MKGYLIDSTQREIREVEYVTQPMESPLSLQSHIGGYIEVAHGWENGDVLFVDEEGLLKPQLYFFRIDVRQDQPFAGNGVVVGRERTNPATGDYLGTDDPVISLEALRAAVTWLTRDQVDAWAKGNASEPASAIYFPDENGNLVGEVTGHIGELYAAIPKPPRAEHLAWAKGRALEFIDLGDGTHAVASLISDLSKHDAWKNPALLDGARTGMVLAIDGNMAALRRWIEDFT
jgi:hypothetical protein